MAEFVQKRKEEMITEIPLLQTHFKKSTVKRILNQREKFEYRLMRRNKQKSDFTLYITFLKSVIKKIEKISSENPESQKLISQHRNRITSLYRAALKYFKHDVSLWKEYIKFLTKYKQIRTLRTALDNALLLHGHISDDLYVFAVQQEFVDLKNIQKAREMYTVGLRAHKNSSALYLEAFKCELAYSEILIEKMSNLGEEYNANDPVLNGSLAKAIFESAMENIKDDYYVFLKMFREAQAYTFALDLSTEIKNFMLTKFCLDPSYWDTLAQEELKNSCKKTEKIKIKNCLDLYDEALTLIDTDEMWNKYLMTILNLTSDSEKTEVFKRNLLRQSMYNAHIKNKLKPHHYIQWINKSQGSLVDEIIEWAVEKYPNDTNIFEIKLRRLINTDKQLGYELFKQNVDKVSTSIWITIVQDFKNEPQINEIFNMVFGNCSVCKKELKTELGNEYLLWLNNNKSLDDVRNAYKALMINNEGNAVLCKTLVTIETQQEKIDITKVRQHFILACMQFGKTNIDLWMDRIYFELKYGSPKIVSSTYHQALTTLNNEESDKFAEEYSLKAQHFNKL